MDEPTNVNLDKRLALLEQAVKNGFDNLSAEIRRWTSDMRDDIGIIRGEVCENKDRLDRIEPFVLSAQATWAIAWKILVGVGVVGILWAVAQSGALMP